MYLPTYVLSLYGALCARTREGTLREAAASEVFGKDVCRRADSIVRHVHVYVYVYSGCERHRDKDGENGVDEKSPREVLKEDF